MTQKEFEEVWNDERDYVVCHTSGSTGIPKEIRLPKWFMRESARRTNRFFSVTEGSRLHTCLDFKYIASKMMAVRAAEANCRLTSEEPSMHPLENVAGDDVIDLLSVVPAQMDWILDSNVRWSGIRHILVGGSPVPKLMRRRIVLSGYDVWETYGMTETASHIALRKVSDEDGPFVSLDGITVDLDGRGCLEIRMPDGQKLTTNDIAETYTPDEFRILGRADSCIISGGVKIIPEDLESRLGSFIAFDYCISSVDDQKWGEKLVLVVEKGAASFEDDFLKAAIGVRLRQYRKILDLGIKSPKEIILMDRLPRTSNGKIDRSGLKQRLSGI